MTSLQLEGTKRTDTGKAVAKQLRDNGEVLCNLYGGNENISFSAPYNAFTSLIYNPNFFAVDVTVNGKTYKTIIKEIQFHPVNDRIQHVDFLELVPGKMVIADIPIELQGLAAGVKNGGKLVQKMRTIKVKATPENLVEKIALNVEKLKLGKSLKVRDINPGGLEIMASMSIPVASVEIPRALRGGSGGGADDEDEEGETAEAAEGAEAATEETAAE